jgi:hypothetical protein
MLTTARPLASSIEQANEPKPREAAKPAKRQPQPIHPSLRALPDYPE